MKFSQIATMWQCFRVIGRGTSENAWRKKEEEKNICGKTEARPELPFRAA